MISLVDPPAVIAVVGVVIERLLPARRTSREVVQRTECRNCAELVRGLLGIVAEAE